MFNVTFLFYCYVLNEMFQALANRMIICWWFEGLAREHSPLEVSLYCWSPVLQVITQLLHYILITTYYMLWSNPIMSTCAVILPPTMNKKIRFRLYMGCYYFLPSNVQFKVDSLKRYDKKYASPKVLKLSFLFKLSCVEISRISCFLVIRFLNVPLCLPCYVAFIYAVS